jgi:hypothetical protein
MSEMMINNSLVKVQSRPPYALEQEIPVLLNPLARAIPDGKASFEYPKRLPTSAPVETANLTNFAAAMEKRNAAGVGIDHGTFSNTS